MSNEPKHTKEECCAPFEVASFSAMTEQMMAGRQGRSSNCMEIMSQLMGQQEMGCGCATPDVMAKFCVQAQDEWKTCCTGIAHQA